MRMRIVFVMNAAPKAKSLPLRPTSMSILDGLREMADGWERVAACAHERSLVASPLTCDEVGVVLTAAEVQLLAVAEQRFALAQAECYRAAAASYRQRQALYAANPRRASRAA